MSTFDLLIKNSIVFDGTGEKPFNADIGIIKNKIALIEKSIPNSSAKKIIDTKGLAVSPGFIDTHSHSEFTILADPRAEGKISQGVTTEINGNCGMSAAPLLKEAFEHREKDLKELGIKERWKSLKEYLNILRKKGTALNFATLAGHGNIRASVIGYKDTAYNSRTISRMQNILKETLRQGAIGISTGLIYPPGIYSDTEELMQLTKKMPKNKKIYTSHMRSEGNRLIESISEIIRIGREGRTKIHISHIKTSGKNNWHKINSAISLIEHARSEGIKITCDRYPYTASSTDLDTILPSWTYDGGTEQEITRLKKKLIRENIKKQIIALHPDNDYWERVSISSISTKKNKWMEGKTLHYISKKIKKDYIETLFQILLEEKLRVSAIFSTMNEDNLIRFLSLPYTMIGSDSSARCSSGITSHGKPHPRGFGTFPRFLGRYVRDKKLMEMSKAIHKITMLSADTFGIKNRGVIKKNAFADIVIFDLEKIIDKATFVKPFLKSEGIHHVIVNGGIAYTEGKLTNEMSGMILI
ncbi:MAG: D-aminoacylase [Nitrospiraceae bacterium]|nr:D-aminoacylase [Nitrospiraceae bacterium]